jgi:hypothetical protein
MPEQDCSRIAREFGHYFQFACERKFLVNWIHLQLRFLCRLAHSFQREIDVRACRAKVYDAGAQGKLPATSRLKDKHGHRAARDA